jgi:hypothetical protein
LKPDRNQELTKLIGRRLRDACEEHAPGEFPAAMAEGLAKIRQAESLPTIDVDISTSSTGNCSALECASADSDGARPIQRVTLTRA